MRKYLMFLLVASVFLVGVFASDLLVASGQNVYSLQLQGFAWNHSTLSALIITPDNASWWNPVYVNSTVRAMGQWNDGLEHFAANYSAYGYLAGVGLSWQFSNVSLPGYDVYVNWTQASLSSSADEIGLTKTFISRQSVILNCSISLAVQTGFGSTLDEVDMQNVALHELGHTFGLGHSNYTGDLMYSVYTLGSSPEDVSTLDAYGVATAFAWMLNSSDFFPISGWLTENEVSLPSAITYSNLPVSPANAPPQTFIDNPVVQFFVMVFGFLLLPEIGIPLLIVIIVFVVVALIPSKRRRRPVMAGS